MGLRHRIVNLNRRLRLKLVSSVREWSDDAGALRRFGLALVRDDRFVFDDVAAGALIEKLFRQATLTLVDCPGEERRAARVRAFAQFVRLYRRHARRLALDEDGGWIETPPSGRGCGSVAVGVRSLPLELREALLLVALAGFTHCEAAEALDLPLAVVIDRLARARTRLAAHMAASRDAAAAWPQSAHLRIVK
jgi:RNA polymerase sigma-70 factor (ECF subfamily)